MAILENIVEKNQFLLKRKSLYAGSVEYSRFRNGDNTCLRQKRLSRD